MVSDDSLAQPEQQTATPQETAFVISQVGEQESDIRRRADDVFDHIIRPAVEEFGLSPLRADQDPTPGQITSRILRSILDARIVVADLTGRNANVYYELGVVHSFVKPVVILVDRIASLSFDTQNERVIEIGDNGKIGVSEAVAARDRLKQALQVVLTTDYQASSIITEVAAAQSLASLAPENPIASELAAISERIDLMYDVIAHIPRLPASGPGYSTLEEVPIEDLDFTVRQYNILKRNNVQTIGDLVSYSEGDFRRLPGMTEPAATAILLKIQEFGLRLRKPQTPSD